MATAVGLRSVISKHWTGSLLELDSTRYEVNDDKNKYLADSDEHDYQYWKGIPTDISQFAWASRSRTFCSLDPGNARSLDTISMDVSSWSNSTSDSPNDSQNSTASLSFEQLLGLSQLLKFIHGRSPSRTSNRRNMNGNNKDMDYKDAYGQRRTGTPSWKCALAGQKLLCNQTSSLTNLPNSICADPNLPIELHDPISLILNRPKRRHYNSESELFLPETVPCDVSNDSQNPQVNGQKESAESMVDKAINCEHPKAEPCEVSNDNPYSAPTEDLQTSKPINRVDNAGETEALKTAEPESQNCTVTDETKPLCMTKEDERSSIEQTNFEEQSVESIELTDKQNGHEPKCTDKDNVASNDNNDGRSDGTTDLADPVIATNTTITTSRSSSSSLITNRASRTSLKISKSVSFADEIGQCLTETFVFNDDEEQISVPEYDDFFDDPLFEPRFKLKVLKSNNQNRFTRSRIKYTSNDPLFENQTTQYKSPEVVSPTSDMSPNQSINLEAQPMWNLTFPQPASQYYEFRHRLESNSVSLESITLAQPGETGDTEQVKLSGTIKVKNISFEKHVWLRISLDNWQTFVDYPTNYSPELSAGAWSSPTRFDTFVFLVTLNLPKTAMSKDQKIEFAIRYVAGPNAEFGEYWDSNNGRNYVIELKMVRPVWTHTTEPTVTNTKPAEYSSTQNHNLNPYTLDYRPNFDGFSSFTDYRAWRHFAGETSYY